jgi:hypothetical protein
VYELQVSKNWLRINKGVYDLHNMSMIVTTICPDGIIMAADSASSSFRMMDMINFKKGNITEAITNTIRGTYAYDKENILCNKIISRSISKLHVMKGNNIAISYGNQVVKDKMSISPHIDYFCNKNQYSDPKSCAMGLFDLVKDTGFNMECHVCGYNLEDKIPFPEFWYVNIEANIVTNVTEKQQYGISFCGANEYFSQYISLINEKIRYYSLQDAIDVSLFAIEMSIKLERFIDMDEHIVPPIDLLVIKPTGVEWVQQKTLRGEL